MLRRSFFTALAAGVAGLFVGKAVGKSEGTPGMMLSEDKRLFGIHHSMVQTTGLVGLEEPYVSNRYKSYCEMVYDQDGQTHRKVWEGTELVSHEIGPVSKVHLVWDGKRTPAMGWTSRELKEKKRA